MQHHSIFTYDEFILIAGQPDNQSE